MGVTAFVVAVLFNIYVIPESHFLVKILVSFCIGVGIGVATFFIQNAVENRSRS